MSALEPSNPPDQSSDEAKTTSPQPASSPGGDWVETGPAAPPARPLPWALVGMTGVVGAVVAALLMGRPGTPSASVTGTPASSSAASHGAAARPAEPPPAWTTTHADRWTGGRRRSVAYELEAANVVKVWMKHVRPVLVVRCLGSRTDAFVFTDSPARIEPEPDTRTVRVRLDDAQAATERWTASAGHDGLFAPDGREFASRLAAAHRLEFGFTPQNADPVTVAFDLGDIAPVVEHVTRACRGK